MATVKILYRSNENIAVYAVLLLLTGKHQNVTELSKAEKYRVLQLALRGVYKTALDTLQAAFVIRGANKRQINALKQTGLTLFSCSPNGNAIIYGSFVQYVTWYHLEKQVKSPLAPLAKEIARVLAYEYPALADAFGRGVSRRKVRHLKEKLMSDEILYPFDPNDDRYDPVFPPDGGDAATDDDSDNDDTLDDGDVYELDENMWEYMDGRFEEES